MKKLFVSRHKKRLLKRNKILANRVPSYILAVIFFLFALTLIFPFLWLIYNSVKDKIEFFLNPWAVPKSPLSYLSNYAVIFKDFGIAEMFFNSVFLSVLGPLITVFFTSCAAYAYARHTFKLKPLLYAVAITPMIVNIAGTLPSMYRLINNMGIYDSLPGILLTSTSGFGFNFLLVTSVFVNISNTYKEAAMIDGAGRWRIFLTIYMPQASHLLVSLYILSVIGVWNDYTTPYLYLPSHPTLATGIQNISQLVSVGNSKYSNDYPKLFASMIVTILPVLLLFIIFQDRIMKMVMGGGIKE